MLKKDVNERIVLSELQMHRWICDLEDEEDVEVESPVTPPAAEGRRQQASPPESPSGSGEDVPAGGVDRGLTRGAMSPVLELNEEEILNAVSGLGRKRRTQLGISLRRRLASASSEASQLLSEQQGGVGGGSPEPLNGGKGAGTSPVGDFHPLAGAPPRLHNTLKIRLLWHTTVVLLSLIHI